MQIAPNVTGSNKDLRRAVTMFRLDYISCFLTIVATILVGRKMWAGLVVSGVNSLVVCVIGLHTSQYGFIPANVFCICINAFHLRAWLTAQKGPSESTTYAGSKLLTGDKFTTTFEKAATRRSIKFFGIRRHLNHDSEVPLCTALERFGHVGPLKGKGITLRQV
jgi:hypothetical protein